MQPSKFQQTIARYFERFEHFNIRYHHLPAPKAALRQVIVIPAFAEDLSSTLQSLGRNKVSSPSATEVLIVLNNSQENKEVGALHGQQAEEWHGKRLNNQILVQVILADDLPAKHAGVGLARKIGMDIALARFSAINHDGFIVCLDADCEVSENYLNQLENFERNPAIKGMSLHFEHKYNELTEPFKKRIIDYEIWLRYYIEALRFANYPHAYHTVGSSMLCRASAYAKIGGMNKKKAGEDFYFLHKLMPQGGFVSSSKAIISPSARISTRVPFGTGRAMLEQENGRKVFSLLYHPDIFKEIKDIHKNLDGLYRNDFPPTFEAFLLASPKVEKGLKALIARSKNSESFVKNFFFWWDGFTVLQYVHFRQQALGQLPSAEACKVLLDIEATGAALLDKLRRLEIDREQAYL